MARTKGAVALTDIDKRFVQIRAEQGATAHEIAQELERSVKTIYKLLAEYRANPPKQRVVPLGVTRGEV